MTTGGADGSGWVINRGMAQACKVPIGGWTKRVA